MPRGQAGSQQRHGRRGFVFSVRVVERDRELLELRQAQGGGPRALGPWLLWRALSCRCGPATAAWSGTTATAPDPSPAAVRDGSGPGNTRSIGDQAGARGGSTAAAVMPAPAERLILDLCAGSGSWSAPYAEAGYRVERVTLPEHDVRTFVPPEERVWGILAAPPCDQFSLARNGCETERDFIRGMETVNACMRIIAQARPTWWALENPVGLLSKWLGTPADTFEPCDFGDPWTKRTALWGQFQPPSRGPFVPPVGGGPLCTVCDPSQRRSTWCSNPAHRAKTPAGFARAFFVANP